jgi:cell wall-associated NlpC family hydrolase
VQLALSMVGVQYRYGGAHPREGFDCSGLVFFQDQEKLSHVGIYLGDGRFVHAPSSGGSVRVANIDAPYYQRHLVGVGRLLP